MRTKRKSTVLIFTFAVAFCLAGLSATAHAQDVIVKWEQINGLTYPGSANTVAGYSTYTYPWSVNWGPYSWGMGGGAKVDLTTGEVEFFVHGLALAGGPYIGTTIPVTEVYGVLVCNDWANYPPTPGASFPYPTTAVTLSAEGNAYFSGTLGSSYVSGNCTANPTNVAFLIVDNLTGTWIAYGAVPVSQGFHHHH